MMSKVYFVDSDCLPFKPWTKIEPAHWGFDVLTVVDFVHLFFPFLFASSLAWEWEAEII